ncbi:Fc.00g085060.m01.CDS01 [Cosmosporella sp. VM-42]
MGLDDDLPGNHQKFNDNVDFLDAMSSSLGQGFVDTAALTTTLTSREGCISSSYSDSAPGLNHTSNSNSNSLVSVSPAARHNNGIDTSLFTDAGLWNLWQPSPYELVPSFAPFQTPYMLQPSSPGQKDMQSLVLTPAHMVNSRGQSSGRAISSGCRRFIVSILRTYPRMMTKLDNLPPFIHPVGCGLHWDQEEAGGVNYYAPEPSKVTPLKPLAVCHSVAHIFVSRSPSSEEFLWRTIDSEQRRIMNETLAEQFYKLCPEPFSPCHERVTRPRWEDWIFEETRRRIAIVCFLMTLVVGSEESDAFEKPSLLPLPTRKDLWGAPSALIWEKEHDSGWGKFKTNPHRLCTIGDVAIAQMQRGSGGALDDTLDSWHAGLDNLGMMLAAFIADV